MELRWPFHTSTPNPELQRVLLQRLCLACVCLSSSEEDPTHAQCLIPIRLIDSRSLPFVGSIFLFLPPIHGLAPLRFRGTPSGPPLALFRLGTAPSSRLFLNVHRTCRLGFPGPHNAFETGARIEHVVGFRVPTCFPSHLGVGAPGCESRGFVLPGIAPLRRCPHIQGGEAASPPSSGRIFSPSFAPIRAPGSNRGFPVEPSLLSLSRASFYSGGCLPMGSFLSAISAAFPIARAARAALCRSF